MKHIKQSSSHMKKKDISTILSLEMKSGSSWGTPALVPNGSSQAGWQRWWIFEGRLCGSCFHCKNRRDFWLTLIVDDLLLPLLQLVLQIIFTAVHYYTDLCSYFSYLLFLKHLSTEMQTRHLWLHKSVVKVPSSMQIGLVQFQLFYKLVVTCSVFLVYHWDI